MDGWTSLAVFVGALGVWLGYPLADPVVGVLIAATILWLVWQSGMMVLIRALDGVNPEMITELRHAAAHASGVQAVTKVQARWVGHHLLHHVRYLSEVSVHVDPLDKTGEEHHRIADHVHDGLPPHSH